MGKEAATNGEEAVELTPQQQEIEQKFAQAGELMKQQQWSEAIPVFNEVFPLERFSTKLVGVSGISRHWRMFLQSQVLRTGNIRSVQSDISPGTAPAPIR